MHLPAVKPLNRALRTSSKELFVRKIFSFQAELDENTGDGSGATWNGLSPGMAYFWRGVGAIIFPAIYGYPNDNFKYFIFDIRRYIIGNVLRHPSPIYFFLFRITIHVAIVEVRPSL